jgi:hypothetical protein
MKTFLQRWWIINRLNKFCKIKGGYVWVEEEEFISYIKTIVVKKSTMTITNLIRFPYGWLFEIKDDLILYNKIKNIIDECSDPNDGVDYIVKIHRATYQLRLSSLGRERYSFLYIIFNTDYAKTIWTGVIVGLVIIFFTNILSTKSYDKYHHHYLWHNNIPN